MGKSLGLNRYLTDEELQQFFANLKGNHDRQRIIFLLLAYGGLRINEAVRVNIKDFTTPSFNALLVANTKTANRKKGKPARIETVQLPTWLGLKLKEYLNQYGSKLKKGYLFFPDGHGSRQPHISKNAVRMFLTRKRRTLPTGFQETILTVNYKTGRQQKHYRIGTHSFRRWYVTKIYKNSGNDIKLASQLARHKDITTTQVYIDGFELMQKAPLIINTLPQPKGFTYAQA